MTEIITTKQCQNIISQLSILINTHEIKFNQYNEMNTNKLNLNC